MSTRLIIVSILGMVALAYIARWWWLERARSHQGLPDRQLRPLDAVAGCVTNFFDTLGIGSFAPTTAYFKLTDRMPDEKIPGTLNSGQCLPSMTQALIFIAAVGASWCAGRTVMLLSHERPPECKGGGADGGDDGSESAASLIQSVTVHIVQSGPLPRVPVVVQHVGNSDIGLAIFIAVP